MKTFFLVAILLFGFNSYAGFNNGPFKDLFLSGQEPTEADLQLGSTWHCFHEDNDNNLGSTHYSFAFKKTGSGIVIPNWDSVLTSLNNALVVKEVDGDGDTVAQSVRKATVNGKIRLVLEESTSNHEWAKSSPDSTVVIGSKGYLYKSCVPEGELKAILSGQ